MALVQGDQRKDCCKVEANLQFRQLSEDSAVNVCQVCGCRHFELTLNPGQLGVKGMSI